MSKDKAEKEQVVNTKEELHAVQDALIKRDTSKYSKMGLNQLQAKPDVLLKDEIDRIKKEAKTNKGAICGCCGQKVKMYRRTITAEMCVALILVYKYYRHHPNADTSKYYTKEEFFMQIIDDKDTSYIINDFTKLKYWDLLAPMPTHPDKVIYKKGHWGLTDNGAKFVQREIAMPKYALVYNDMVDSHITEPVMIDEILSEAGFDYTELLKVEAKNK